ncbi:unnamed protein product [Caenorhabditis angaria]|uniref:Uncharacterized protein n=1 Tax=Caenorhabditis angaria TaxID=860376 RepID=A0A9P1IM38_9PELO|nr:unnamed protein product [Caenorhabditis angaria]
MIHTKIKQIKGDENESNAKIAENDAKRIEDVELNIKFGYDRHLQNHDSFSTESHSANAKPFAEEEFDNEDEAVISPLNKVDPDPDGIEAEELDQQYKSENYAGVSDFSHLFLMLAAGTDYIELVEFTIFFQNSGGIYSLIPYIFFLLFFSFPVSIYEVALAQFSSLPLFSLFHHMAPVLGGVPIVTSAIRVLYLTHIALRPKLYTFTYNLLYSALVGDLNWMHCTRMEGISCYDPFLKCFIDEDQVAGKCQPIPDLEIIHDLSSSTNDRYSRVHNLQYNGIAGTQITSLAKIYDEPDLLAGSFIFFIVVGLAFNAGYKRFAQISPLIAILPIVSMLPICFIVLSKTGDDVFEEVEKRDDMGKLLKWTTYFHAFIHAFSTAQCGQGSLLTFGSKVHFYHNFMKDIILNILYAVGYRLYYLMTFLPIYYACQEFLYPFKTDAITENSERNQLLELFYGGLPIITGVDARNYLACLSLFFATINLAMLAECIVTFEVFKSCIYIWFPRILYLNSTIVRAIIIVFFISLSMLHEWFTVALSRGNNASLNNHFQFGLISSTFVSTIFMLLGVRFLYGDSRLYVNCLTMLKKNERSYKMFLYFKKYFLATWTLTSYFLFIPFIYCTIQILSTYKLYTFQYTFIIGFPILYMLWCLVRGYLTNNNISVLTSCHKWKPVHFRNEREAIAHEKMFGIGD